MTATATLERPVDIDDLLSESRTEAEAKYRQLVVDLAEGNQATKGDDVHAILFAAGRTIVDLKRHVARARERRDALADRERVEALTTSLPELEAKRNAAAAAVKAKREQQQREIEPLLTAQCDAHADCKACGEEIRSLRNPSLATLNRTISPEYLAEFGRLSTAVQLLENKIRDTKIKLANDRKRLPEIESFIARLEGELLRVERKPECGDTEQAISNIESQIAAQRALVERISSDDSINEVVAQHEAAREALAKLERERFFDWREINFDFSTTPGEDRAATTRRQSVAHTMA